jgi:hypothetical protein
MKIALIVLSDPKAGEDALGRVFNALALAAEAVEKGDRVEIVFTGAGTRWPGVLSEASHPANPLYKSLIPVIAGVCTHCASAFGATEEVSVLGLPFVQDNAVSGTLGLASIRRYLEEGWSTLTF